MKTLAVPAAAPRSDTAAVEKIAEKKAGVLKVTPTASRRLPETAPIGSDQMASTIRPAAMVARAAAPRGSEGNRSGTLANTMRQATTIAP